ncbi:RNA-binding domain-containing protein [Teratosphaeria nubilosa]|uniref:RNA-binding domain-containing protein n=1 Tax=Teratosphaeria nubilosa TaxID=161662 RepID=A0A6G1LKF7_9PEZI|nr:RNA-binding domain-containing protein [Teratosphaeria nubilosa]
MYILKRVAIRALAQQPSRQLSTLRSSSRFTYRPALAIRSFHQSQTWKADEEAKEPAEASPAEAPASGVTVTTKSTAAEEAVKQDLAEGPNATLDVVENVQSAPQTSASQDAVAEASGTTSEPLGQSETQNTEEKSSTEQAQQSTSSAAEAVQKTASAAAQSVQETASSAAESVKDAFRHTIAPAASTASAAAASQALPRRRDSGQRFNTPNKILYVGNLFFEVTASQIENEFAKLGEVTNSRVVTDSRGLSKGFGYIEFAEQKAADEAVRLLDQKVFQGRRMAVQYHQKREPRTLNSNETRRTINPPSKTLFIGNMSYQMSDRDLNDLFRQIRNVLDVRVAIDRRSGQPRGFAHADFVDEPAATAAKEILEKKVIYGRQLKVDYSTGNNTTQS